MIIIQKKAMQFVADVCRLSKEDTEIKFFESRIKLGKMTRVKCEKKIKCEKMIFMQFKDCGKRRWMFWPV